MTEIRSSSCPKPRGIGVRRDGRGVADHPARVRRMFDIAEAAVEGAVNAGARYADARVVVGKSQSLEAKNGDIEALNQGEKVGVGVRALIGSSWGFFATQELSAAAA